MSATAKPDPAILDILDPQVRCSSPAVRAAAQADWWARTPIGLAVLRYQECIALLRDRRLRHGSLDALAAQGVTFGPFAEWMSTMLLNIEGEQHQRLPQSLRPVVESQQRGEPEGLGHRASEALQGWPPCLLQRQAVDPVLRGHQPSEQELLP
ncbi:MAG: hypothetical protein ACRDTE_29915 [Pseudonocardiaceae bacterium]